MAEITIKTVKISQIQLNPDNPRTITGPALDKLIKSLKDFPEMMELREIVVDESMTHKNTSGVYAIFNSIDDRIYIGSAVLIGKRIREHKNDLCASRHKNIHLQRFFNKYGPASLHFALIREVQKEHLISVEQFFIDALRPAFNINLKADSSLGIKRRPETRKRLSETRLAMKIRHGDDYKRRMSIALSGKNNPMYGKSPNWGKRHRPETIQKMIKSHRDVKGPNNPKYGIPQDPAATEKSRATWRRKMLTNGRGIKAIKNGEVVSIFHSAMEAARELNINFTSIYRSIKKRQGRCKGYVFSFTGGPDAIPQNKRP